MPRSKDLVDMFAHIQNWGFQAVPLLILVLLISSASPSGSQGTEILPGSDPLSWEGDLAAEMVSGIDRFLTRELNLSTSRREQNWQRTLTTGTSVDDYLSEKRARLKQIIGAVDERLPNPNIELISSSVYSSLVAETSRYSVRAIRWQVFEGVYGEGLLLEPRKRPRAQLLAIPDADWTPEMLIGLHPGVPIRSQFARWFAESGCRVIIPVLISRSDTFSGNPHIQMTDQSHREFIYRQAFEMGRHIIGYEVQKLLSAIDWFEKQQDLSDNPLPIGIIGYGEGGLLALYSSAIDDRIQATMVSGYFQQRNLLWREPIYRNVWGFLTEFGDAGLARLIAPRPLIIETSEAPSSHHPTSSNRKKSAAPGTIETASLASVLTEVSKARKTFRHLNVPDQLKLITNGMETGPPGNESALRALSDALQLQIPDNFRLFPPAADRRPVFSPHDRQKRQLDQLTQHTQRLAHTSSIRRNAFWSKANSTDLEHWQTSTRWYRNYFWDEVIGRFPPATLPLNPRTRKIYDEPAYSGYEVILDVWPDVFTYGIILIPKDLKPDEQRPVVVCQHGLEGRPQMVTDPRLKTPYHSFGAQLANRGFIVYAPQNPYIGGNHFRILQRKANPLKKSLFSIIVRQHEQTLKWLKQLPYVASDRIGFYGLSYGGMTAMRIPALLDDYCLSICSANFNEWTWKTVHPSAPYSYLFTPDYEIFEFDLGNTFNYAEMSALILPRPFMVERGHDDGVAPDEWVAYEYAKVRRQYSDLRVPENTDIHFFKGTHEIHGTRTFDFLHHHLRWPTPIPKIKE